MGLQNTDSLGNKDKSISVLGTNSIGFEGVRSILNVAFQMPLFGYVLLERGALY